MGELQPVDVSGVERILCVVAHPDDMEYGGSAAVAAWTAQGIEVHYLLLTAGEAGISSIEPRTCAAMRREEQQRACDAVGASSLQILDFPDGLLEPSLEVRRAIARKIREVRPQVVMSLTWELDVAFGINHVDHRACGLALMDAVRDADNPWLFPELGESGLERWKADRAFYSAATRPTHYQDVSGPPLAAGIASLSSHEGYLAALPEHPSPAEVHEGSVVEPGRALGLEAALPLRVIAL